VEPWPRRSKCIPEALPTFAIPAGRRSTCGRFDTALARKPPRGPADVGKLRDRALRISSVADQWGPDRGQGFSQGLCLVRGASYSVAYQRNHSRSRQPTNALAAERWVGCQHALKASAGRPATCDRRRLARMGRVRRRPSLSTDQTRALQRMSFSMAGAEGLPARRYGDHALAVAPRAGRPGSDASSYRRLTVPRPTTVCCGHAPRKISLS
jgi:hypothetical protein